MTDSKQKIIAYKKALAATLCQSCDYFIATQVYDNIFCDQICPIGETCKEEPDLYFERCAERIAEYFMEES